MDYRGFGAEFNLFLTLRTLRFVGGEVCGSDINGDT